jgi:predicted MFS family arabinose efflux permease
VIDLSQRRGPSLIERWYVLIVMCLIYALNIADRYVVSTVLEPIRIELRLTDAGVALLTGVPLALFYSGFGLIVAWLADRSNRRNIVAASLIIWSAFTVACGLSIKYWQLLLSRMGVGIGEAGGTPPSSAILADYFPAVRRPMAFTVFALGAPIGAWLGADLAAMSAHAFGWRAAFLVLGVPGIVLGLVVFFTVREPERGQLDAADHHDTPSFMDAVRLMWRQKAAFHIIMASGVSSLWGWGLVWWLPTFLMRTYDLDVGEAGAITGPIHLFGGASATLLTAWLFARPSMVDPRRVLTVLGAGIGLTTIPSIIAVWTHSLGTAQWMLWLFIPAIYFFIGPCMGLLQNLAPAPMRAMVFAWSGLVGNVFNLIVAPQGVGLLSDWFSGPHGADASSLRLALLVLAPTGFWATYHYYLATRTVVEDQARAIGYRDLRFPRAADPLAAVNP